MKDIFILDLVTKEDYDKAIGCGIDLLTVKNYEDFLSSYFCCEASKKTKNEREKVFIEKVMLGKEELSKMYLDRQHKSLLNKNIKERLFRPEHSGVSSLSEVDFNIPEFVKKVDLPDFIKLEILKEYLFKKLKQQS